MELKWLVLDATLVVDARKYVWTGDKPETWLYEPDYVWTVHFYVYKDYGLYK